MVEHLKLEQFYAQRGIELITPEVGTQVLARVIGQRPAHLVAIMVNWALARQTAPGGEFPAMFTLLGTQTGEGAVEEAVGDDQFLQQVRAAETTERLSLLTTHMQTLVARVLQLDAEQFSEQESLTSLGIDSMMAIEVKNRIAQSVKVDVSVLELLQGVTVVQLATRILAALQFEEASATEEAAPSLEMIQRLVEQANTEELERLLAELEQETENQATA